MLASLVPLVLQATFVSCLEISLWGDGKALDDPSSNVLDGDFGFVPFFVLMRAVVHLTSFVFCPYRKALSTAC